MLITEFVDCGIMVLTVSSDDTIVLAYDVLVIKYKLGRFVREAPGTCALLGAGSYSEVIKTEVLINASLLWQDGYVARYTDIYHVPDSDSGHNETEDGSVIVAGDDGSFSIVYDSYLRSLTDVREEAEQRCARDGLLASITGRDMAHRMQPAYFSCYTP